MRDDILGLGYVRMFPQANMTPQTTQTLRSFPTLSGTTSPTASLASQLAQASQRAALNTRNAQLITNGARNAQLINNARLTQNATNARLAQNATSTRLAQNATRYTSPLLANPNQRSSTPSTNHTLGRPTSPRTPLGGTIAPKTPYVPRESTPARPAAPIQKPEPPKPPTSTDPNAPMSLGAYPHPNGDNGRGMHWIPTTSQSTDAVDRFVAEAKRMGVKWVTFLNDGANVGQNDYLVKKLVGAGIEPIMRCGSQPSSRSRATSKAWSVTTPAWACTISSPTTSRP
jgi:hypothetical protein